MRVTEMKVTNKRAADRKGCWKVVITVLFTTAAMNISALVGQWRQDDTGWWYRNENGTYLKSEWFWIDGKYHYSSEDGYCLQSAQTPDGYSVDAQGARIEGDVVRTQEQSQSSSAIEQTDNVVVTIPSGFVFHFSDERGICMTSVDGSSLICIMSESLADFKGHAKLIYTCQERVLGTTVEAEPEAPQSKTTSHLASGPWYYYRYMDASSLGILGFLKVYARISEGRVQMIVFGSAISPLDTGGMMNSLALLWQAVLIEGRDYYIMQVYTYSCGRVIWTKQDRIL